MIIIMES